MISAYGPAINYIDILQKKNAIRWLPVNCFIPHFNFY
jgi:hypothetical protein